ncbi:hypothetical protein LTR70_004099 [Exophiala xenobiotica]|uniref:Uncharacterized protein n=1 Tax=Lithohypha guttulata TaxID=1690604 RepID=A0ABR0KEI1_9EURO|nr:hypothetical protein LTR24_003621 [Lithohypha guttulata]KAK5321544.1 hypothetical protein LTR70_004099 [Exophiala xenobiotica]
MSSTSSTNLFYTLIGSPALQHSFTQPLDAPLKASFKMQRPRTGLKDVSADLASLNHESKQNKKLPKLPPNTTITRRPINHAPVAHPAAGPKVQKVVYVSRKTPVISAVKRVKKFLSEIEKRALQSAGVDGVLERRGARGGGDEALQRKLGEVSERLARDAEEVLVKASGRAMEQALRVGEWFRSREDEVLTKVEVRCGSVSVVDDIVERQEDGVDPVDDEVGEDKENEGEATVLDGGDTTMELLKNLEKGGNGEATRAGESLHGARGIKDQAKQVNDKVAEDDGRQPKMKRKRKRKEYDAEDLPEARIRWVKTVEVAISLRA